MEYLRNDSIMLENITDKDDYIISKSLLLEVDRYVIAAIFLVIMTAGLFGNGLVIAAVCSSKNLRSVTYAFVVALSISDLLTMLNIPLNTVAILSIDGWKLPEWICVANSFCALSLIGFSLATMACISVNRLTLFTVSREIHDKIFSSRNTALIILIVAAINLSVPLSPILFDFGKLGYDERFSTCTWDKSHKRAYEYELFAVMIQYPIQLIVCIGCYTKLYFVIRKQTHVMLAHNCSTASSRSSNLCQSLSRRQMEVTKSMFYILCTFLICTAPFAIIMMMNSAGRFGPYSGCILLLNSALNPLIYALKHPDFKTEMKRVLMGLMCRKPREENSINGFRI